MHLKTFKEEEEKRTGWFSMYQTENEIKKMNIRLNVW